MFVKALSFLFAGVALASPFVSGEGDVADRHNEFMVRAYVIPSPKVDGVDHTHFV